MKYRDPVMNRLRQLPIVRFVLRSLRSGLRLVSGRSSRANQQSLRATLRRVQILEGQGA
jgi:hypothetical protein